MKLDPKIAYTVLLLLLSNLVQGQTGSPTTEAMIEQLRPKPLTRGFRNLTVEPKSTTNVPSDAKQVDESTPVISTVTSPLNSAVTSSVILIPARPSISLSIQFDFDSARIRAESRTPLANLIAALTSPELLTSRFLIEGHTDAKGNVEYNKRLSDQRALAVKELLISKGIDAGRLLSVGKGSTELVNPEIPFAAENRRVKIINMD